MVAADTRPEGLAGTEVDEQRRSRWLRPAVLVPGAAVLVLAGGWTAAALALGGTAPRGTTVLGTAVGGLDTAGVAAALTGPAERAGAQPVPVRVTDGDGGVVLEGDLAPAGLGVDVDATAAEVTAAPWSPAALWRHAAGGGERQPVLDVDGAALRAALADQVGGQVDVAPVEGAVTFEVSGAAVEPVVAAPVEGRALDLDAAELAVLDAWPLPAGPVELRALDVATTVSAAEVTGAAERVARPAVDGDLVVASADRSATLAPSAFAPALAVRPVDGRAELVADGPALREAVLAADPGFEQGAQDARIEVVDGRPTVVPAVVGAQVDPQALADAAVAALGPDGPGDGSGDGSGAEGALRRAEVQAAVSEPALTTEELEGLGVVERISTFSTTLTADSARTQNIRLAAEAVDGTLLLPGEEFSLNDTVGERTPERGYQRAGVINDGRLVDGYGGGVSQLSTTLFNAMFFAGLDELEHKPHSFYISRYPEGREATIDWRSIDNRFRNDSEHGVHIEADVVGNEVVVSMYGTARYDVEAVKGPRTSVTQPRTLYDTRAGCSPQSSAPGFTTTVTRVMTPLGGGEQQREVFTTRYNPQNRVVCGPEPSEPTGPGEPGAEPAPAAAEPAAPDA